MRRTWLAGVAGAVLVGGLSTGVVLAAADPDGDKGQSSVGAVDPPGKAKGQGNGFGPPSWAQAHGRDAKGATEKAQKDKAWKDAWQALTPKQREQKMRALGRAHAAGMRDWAQCVEQASRADRANCEKPLPPGHAKRLP